MKKLNKVPVTLDPGEWAFKQHEMRTRRNEILSVVLFVTMVGLAAKATVEVVEVLVPKVIAHTEHTRHPPEGLRNRLDI